MKKTKFRTCYARSEEDQYQGKTFTQPSKTVPDQTMSIREIFQRYAAGLPIGGNINPIYNEDAMGINPKTLDLVDVQQLSMEAQRTKRKYQKATEEGAEQ